MVQAENRTLGVAVAGSVIAHLVVFLLAALYAAFPIFAWDPPQRPNPPKEEEVEVMQIILPPMAEDSAPSAPEVIPDEEGLIPAPEVPLPEPEVEDKAKGFVRTSQNEGEAAPPKSADFISDRNTTAASELPADPNATERVPTQNGREDLPGLELKDREYRDGELKDDEARPTPESAASRPTPPVSPEPIIIDPQPPEDPAKPGERNEATDPDARGPELKTPPETPGEGTATEGVVGESEAPSISIEPLEMKTEPGEEVPPNPLEVEIGPEDIEASIPPPANFEKLIGGEDIFPLPRRSEVTPTPDALLHIDPTMRPPTTPPAEAPAPLPEIRRPEVIMPAVPILPIPPTVASVPSVPLPGDPTTDTTGAYQPHTRKQKMSGTLTNRGPAAVDAEETAVGKYATLVTGTIGRRWHALRSRKADYVTFGNMRIRFDVNRQGRTQNVRILSNDANPILTDFTLAAIMGAQVEPMSPEVLSELSLADGLLEITYNVIIY